VRLSCFNKGNLLTYLLTYFIFFAFIEHKIPKEHINKEACSLSF